MCYTDVSVLNVLPCCEITHLVGLWHSLCLMFYREYAISSSFVLFLVASKGWNKIYKQPV